MGIIVNIGLFLSALAGIYFLRKKKVSFQVLVLSALVLGIGLGLLVKNITPDAGLLAQTVSWYETVGSGYIRLLKMLVIPLIFVSIVYAMISMEGKSGFGKKTLQIISVLLITNAIAAGVGIFYTEVFGLTNTTILERSSDVANIEKKLEAANKMQHTALQDMMVKIIPDNIFYAFSGQGTNPTLSVVFLAFVVSFVAVIMKKKQKSFQTFFDFISSLHDLVMYIVKFVMVLTPYGVLSFISCFIIDADAEALKSLGNFIVASYAAIASMFIIHGLILVLFKQSPVTFFKKGAEALIFAFSSRSSSGTLPITIRTLSKRMGVSEDIANLSASLGTSIGQNGCAGIYPAMVAVMAAASVGIAIDAEFILHLLLVVTISSFGIAGVGGGATNASLVVLSSFNLPVNLIGILTSVEPIIDMARTSLNVSDSLVTGVVVGKINNQLDSEVYNNPVDMATVEE